MKKIILKNVIRSLIIFASAATTAICAAEAVRYSPATFGDAEGVLTQQVNLPNSFGEGVKTVAVYCQADVMTSGNLHQINCYENSPTVSMQSATESALHSARFKPAAIDGHTVPVRMQFRVVYSLSGTQAAIVLLPNLGTLQSRYGVDYVAPQERLDKSDWFMQYSAKARGDGKLFFADRKVTRVMAQVEADGLVESVSTIEAAARKKSEANAIETALKKTRFIPGFVQEKPTPMHYIAVVNYAE